MLRSLIISGGPAHDYARTSEELARTLKQAGFECRVSEDPAMLLALGKDLRLLVLNCARWSCVQTPEWRAQWGYEIPRAEREAMVGYLRGGGGLLALHAATICFDDWPKYREILGAWWEWGRSGHAPFQEHLMEVRTGAHWITRGIPDFRTKDELYTSPAIVDAIEPLVTASWDGKEEPILWIRNCGSGRVCYCALGHAVESFANPTLQRLLQRSALWVARRPRLAERKGEIA